MAEIDQSLYPTANPGGPLATYGKIVDLQNALLSGQQQRQQLAIGQQTQQANQIGINKAQYDLLLQHYDRMANYFAPALTIPPKGQVDPATGKPSEGISDNYIFNLALGGVKAGLYSMDDAQKELQQILPLDDNGRRQAVRQLLGSANSAATNLSAMTPAIQDVGGGQQALQGRAGGPPIPQSGVVPTGVSPATMIGTVVPSGPNAGATQTVPLSQVNPAATSPGFPGGANTGGQAGTVPAGPTGSTVPGGALTSLAPGAAEARQGQAAISVHQSQALQTAVDGIPNARTQLANLSQLLNHFTSGPASDVIRRGKSLFNELTGANLGSDDIAAQDAFVKQATQLAQTQFGQLGGTGTDAKLESAMHTNPSQFLSNQSNREIIAMLNGNLDALQAKGRAWQQYQAAHGPQSYGDFQTEFNDHFDPRVFQMTHLPPKNRADMLKEMSASERTSFLKNFKYAEQQGWVDRNNLQSGQ